ncbi:glycine betaine ABC transporter substrate-binding protein [Blastococcus sp. SYSU D00669]
MRWSRWRTAVLPVVLAALVACGAETPSAPPLPEGTIRFTAYDFAENQVLVAVYAEALRRAGLPVAVEPGLGTREVVEPALEQGVVDVVIDYLGTAVTFLGGGDAVARRSVAELHGTLSLILVDRGVTVLAAAPAEDQNGFAVTTAFAAEHQVGRLSELVPLAPDLVFGGPPECPDRPLCLPGLEEVYGLRFGDVLSMPSRGATVEALLAGEIDVGLLETTDARLGTAPVLLLLDDRGLQPHENVVPLVRTAVLDRWGDRLREALDSTSARLTTQELVDLNRAVEIRGRTPEQAAAEWWSRQ